MQRRGIENPNNDRRQELLNQLAVLIINISEVNKKNDPAILAQYHRELDRIQIDMLAMIEKLPKDDPKFEVLIQKFREFPSLYQQIRAREGELKDAKLSAPTTPAPSPPPRSRSGVTSVSTTPLQAVSINNTVQNPSPNLPRSPVRPVRQRGERQDSWVSALPQNKSSQTANIQSLPDLSSTGGITRGLALDIDKAIVVASRERVQLISTTQIETMKDIIATFDKFRTNYPSYQISDQKISQINSLKSKVILSEAYSPNPPEDPSVKKWTRGLSQKFDAIMSDTKVEPKQLETLKKDIQDLKSVLQTSQELNRHEKDNGVRNSTRDKLSSAESDLKKLEKKVQGLEKSMAPESQTIATKLRDSLLRLSTGSRKEKPEESITTESTRGRSNSRG